MLNAFKMSGTHNILILLSSSKLNKLDNIVNYHFRSNPEINSVSMNMVTEIAKDFILPIDFKSEEHSPTLEEGCGTKCKYKMAELKGLVGKIE
jgi:hypothetical protein